VRLVGAVAGGVIGWLATGGTPLGALQGASIGYSIGGLLGPKQHVLGPKLSDLKAPAADYGAPIAYVIGAPRLAGCVIWSSDKREIATTQSEGKGGPGVDSTTYTYEMDVGIELSINPCDAIRRVWSNGKLVWTVADSSDADSIRASGGVIVGTGTAEGGQTPVWRAIRFYGGAADQMPDPTYETLVGAGNAPAYRGRSTVVIEGLNLGGSGQVPVLTFELIQHAAVTRGSPVIDASVDGPAPFNVGTPAFSSSGYTLLVGQWDNAYANSAVKPYPMPGGGLGADDLGVPTFDVGIQCNAVRGTSDIDCFVCKASSASTNYRAYKPSGSYVEFALGTNIGDDGNSTFARGDGLIVFGACTIFSAAKVLRVFDCETGAHQGDTATMSDYVSGIAIGGGSIYAISAAGTSLFIFDASSLSLTQTVTAPVSASNAQLAYSDRGELYLFYPAAIYLFDGSSFALVTSSPGKLGIATYSQVGAADGELFVLAGNGAGDHEVWTISQRVGSVDAALSDAITELCERTGQLAAGDIDVSALTSDAVHAFAISQVSTTRSAIETLMSAYLFECAEGEQLRFVKRGGAPVLTIPYADLGVSADGTAEPFPVKKINDMEVPARVTVTYANVVNDFQNGTAAGERIVTESTAETSVEVPLGLLPSEAKKLADINTMDLASSMLQAGPLAVSRKYAALEATDVVLATRADGSTLRLRTTKTTYGGGIVSLELVQDDATVINSDGTADDTDNSSTLVRSVAPSQQLELDIPILRDADNDAGFYDQIKPLGDKWSGAAVYSSADDVSYARESTVTASAVFGTCTTTLGDWTGPRVIDWKNSVTVNVGSGVTLASSSRAAILGDQSINACAIGVDGRWELMQFIAAAYISDGVYTLSGLLRGGRGTEWAMTGHAANETFSLLQIAGMARVPVATTLVGIPRYYKAVSINKSIASATADEFTDNGVGLKPFAPVRATVVRDISTGDITFGWQRRSRLATRTIGPAGISIPLGEVTEAYSIDVFTDNTYATVKRTINATTTSAVYTSAQQTADFGSNQATVYFKVYQLSAAVGRGYELKAAA